MKVDHVFGGHIYLISSFGVARNPLFKEQVDIEFFKNNIEKYLGEICDIYAYAHEHNQFQYLVKIKERPILEKFYLSKQSVKTKNPSHKLYSLDSLTPPDSYLIFSQEVSNCLNSYAKKFNFKYKRKGSLFGDRYSKYLVESEEEMEALIQKLNDLEELVVFSSHWQVRTKVEFRNKSGECSSKVYYENSSIGSLQMPFKNFSCWIQNYMRGCFDVLPPVSIKCPKYLDKYQNFKDVKGIPPPW